MELNLVGAITLARFLMSVVSICANIIRSHLRPHSSEAFDRVPDSTSTGGNALMGS